MTSKRFVFVGAFALALAGTASGAIGDDGKAQAFEQALSAAQAAQKKAAAVGGEWRDIGKFIEQAQAAATKGDYDTATRLANKAFRQGELGYRQAMSQKNAGFPPYF